MGIFAHYGNSLECPLPQMSSSMALRCHCFVNNFIEISLTNHTIRPFKVCNSRTFSIVIKLGMHHYNPFQSTTSSPKNPAPSAIPPPSSHFPSPRQTIIYFLSLQTCPFWTYPINRIIQQLILCGRLLSASIMFSRFIRIMTCIKMSFLLIYMDKEYSIV